MTNIDNQEVSINLMSNATGKLIVTLGDLLERLKKGERLHLDISNEDRLLLIEFLSRKGI